MTDSIATLIDQHQQQILDSWVGDQVALLSARGMIKEGELRAEAEEFLRHLRDVLASGKVRADADGSVALRETLTRLSRSRAQQGFKPRETAMFVFGLRKALFTTLRDQLQGPLMDQFWDVAGLLDQLAIFTTEAFMISREEVIKNQQQELLELSTPVVELWEGILALPLIGTLDSGRTQVVMESLLQKIVETGAPFAIIDITGVPYVDTLVAQHLLKTIAAARLMGADCIISGIRPQIAQTIVHLGVDLQDVVTKSTLSDAFALALTRVGARVVRDLKRS
jgi:rsbT co-antagonist protein RsbR